MPDLFSRTSSFFKAVTGILLVIAISPSSRAEYGDIVMNNYSDEAGMRPVIFPHWFHRVRFRLP